jgi:hypothetical protein
VDDNFGDDFDDDFEDDFVNSNGKDNNIFEDSRSKDQKKKKEEIVV